MGLFSFIGKAAKAVGGLIGGPIGAVVKLGGSVLDHKSGGPSGAKIQVMGRQPQQIVRAKAPTAVTYARPGGAPTYVPRQVFSETPVMPGGAIATPGGVQAASGTPPRSFGGARAPTRSSRPRKRTTTTRKKKSSGGRKLKFGSPAWRAKYMKKGRKKKR